jgi:EmrB/QacA subfamily drug resistance transporter
MWMSEAAAKQPFVWLTLVVASLASFIVIIDSSFLKVATTTLVTELHTTVTAIQGMITTYALMVACLVLLGAKLQDIIGRKRVFLYGTLIFGVGTAVSALSINALMLFVGWALLEGVGAALMLPATAALISSTYVDERRAFAFGLWTAIGATAATIGPLLGGLLTTFLSWRAGFGLEAIIIVLLCALSGRLSESLPVVRWRDLDVAGFVLSAAGFFLIVDGILALDNLHAWEFVPALVSAGLLLLVLFVLWQHRRIRRGQVPLTDITLFRARAYSAGNLANLILRLALAGGLFILPAFLQVVTGATAFITGVALIPLTGALLIFSLGSARLSRHLSPRILVPLGFLIALSGSVLLRGVFNLNTRIVDIFPGTTLIGAGIGVGLGPLNNVILSSAPKAKQADASGVLNVTTKLGASLGAAVIGAVLIVSVYSALAAAVGQAHPEYVTAQEVNARVDTLKTSDLQVVKAEQNTTTQIANAMISSAMQHAVDGISLFLFGGFVCSLFIGQGRLELTHPRAR